jgi:hypothetical protein
MLICPTNDPTKWLDVARINPLLPAEADQNELTFQHFAYATESQLLFKERYYGYKGITEQWWRLQCLSAYPVRLKDYFSWPWVSDDAMVDRAEACGIEPRASLIDERWRFSSSAIR